MPIEYDGTLVEKDKFFEEKKLKRRISELSFAIEERDKKIDLLQSVVEKREGEIATLKISVKNYRDRLATAMQKIRGGQE